MTNEEIPEHILLSSNIDRIFESLSHRHRRLILLCIQDADVTQQADLLFREGTDPETTELELTHTHLPKLAEAGYIEWDQETGEISKGPRYDEIEPLLDLIATHADELPPDWP